MSFIRVPNSNTTRLPNRLRQSIDALTVAIVNLEREKDAMAQMTTDAEVEERYDVAAGSGGDLKAVVTSAANELTDPATTPFVAQLISRVS